MMEPAEKWLCKLQKTAKTYDTWEAFCDSQGPVGQHFKGYGWLQKRWEFLKLRGYMTWRTVEYPEARNFTDVFKSARVLPASNDRIKPKVQIPAGYLFLSEQGISPSICGSYGGQRGWSKVEGTRHTITMNSAEAQTGGDGESIRAHYGSTFYGCYVKPRFPMSKFFDGRQGFLGAIKWDDGKVLITAHISNYIGSNWIAILDEGDSLESLLPTEDQEFLARERQAEKDIWG